MPCEYGPSATGALFVWMASFGMIAPPSRNPANLPRAAASVLDFEPRGDPRVDAAVQRAHALESCRAQLLGDLDRARFVRTGAIDDDLAVGRNAVESLGDLLDVDASRAGDAPARLLRQRGSDVEDHADLVRVEERLQLFDGHAVHPQLLDEQ